MGSLMNKVIYYKNGEMLEELFSDANSAVQFAFTGYETSSYDPVALYSNGDMVYDSETLRRLYIKATLYRDGKGL